MSRSQPERRRSHVSWLTGLFGLILIAAGCSQEVKLRDPDEPRVIHLRGTPYEMGFQHGQAYATEIREVYTKFLSNALLPFFSRDQPSIASVLPYYGDERFENGQFAFEFLAEASRDLEPFLPERYREEIRGIADGSGFELEKVMILNTILDSVLSLLNIRVFLDRIEAPDVVAVSFPDVLASDGVDNDEDGETDEPGENVFSPFPASDFAVIKNVPPSFSVRLDLKDIRLAILPDPEGVDLSTMRVRLNDRLFTRGTPGFADNGDPIDARVTITPPEPFPPGPVVMDIELADLDVNEIPPPVAPNVQRLLRAVFLVESPEARLADFGNERDPTAIGSIQAWTLGLTGSATADGATLIGRSMALLDIDVLHDFSTLFVYHPVDEAGRELPPYAVVGYTGIGWAITGMSSRGIVAALNRSETFDDSTIGNVFSQTPYRLRPEGQLGPWVAREILERAETLDEAAAMIQRQKPTTGWNYFLADGPRDQMRVVEVDSDVSDLDPNEGFYPFGNDPSDPVNIDERTGELRASITPDDLRNSVQFVRNRTDGPPAVPLNLRLPFFPPLQGTLELANQRDWAPTFFNAVNVWSRLEGVTRAAYGAIDVDWMIDTMRDPRFFDDLIQMHNAIFLPDTREMYVAMGRLPAVEGRFNHFGPELFEEGRP